MAFRGYFALDGVEIANSSRVVAHIGAEIPTNDLGLLAAPGDCTLDLADGFPLLAVTPPSSVPIAAGRLLGTPADGTRLYSQLLGLVGECWTPDNLCFGCRSAIGYDDTWPGLAPWLGDTIYRPELAPWYSTQVPESAEFGGIWVLDVKGLDSTPVQREVTELAGDGSAVGPHRDASRKVTFDALLVACTNPGLTHGLRWLTCRLRETTTRSDSTLRYLAAHPGQSNADPADLLREVHGVVMTSPPEVQDAINPGRTQHEQAIMYRVSWEMAVTRPHAYWPPIPLEVDWDEVVVEPIQWIHAGDCRKPSTACEDMPVLFGEECVVEQIEVVTSPPPSCGGCMPVCAVETRVFKVPVFDTPYRCRETAVSLSIVNTAARSPLTLQGFFRRCSLSDECDGDLWPVQITGLPAQAELVLDGIGSRYWVNYSGRKRRPFGIVATPTGAPWRPAVIDRALCWEFVVITSGDAEFDVSMSLADREA